jgi:hypothetical protein
VNDPEAQPPPPFCPKTHREWFGDAIGSGHDRQYFLATRGAWMNSARACVSLIEELKSKFELGTSRGDYSVKMLSRVQDLIREEVERG